MNLKLIAEDALNYLFEGYIQTGGTGIFALDEVAQKHGVDAQQLGSLLNEQGWIQNPNYGPFGFSCQISRSGVQQIQPDYFSDLISTAIITAGHINDWTGLLTALGLEPKDYQRVHDLGKVFERNGLAEVQYQVDDVYIKLTLLGMEKYHRENQGGFFS
ncbi:MAG: hypothetical protein ACJ75B_13035 [Flavisolibacter sp.]